MGAGEPKASDTGLGRVGPSQAEKSDEITRVGDSISLKHRDTSLENGGYYQKLCLSRDHTGVN